jgi:hypothetical protein
MKPRTARKKLPKTMRRSVALPRRVVEEASAVAPAQVGQDLNKLVTVALQEFAKRRKTQAFDKAMAQMAADPAIRAECAAIERDFRIAETDGLDP